VIKRLTLVRRRDGVPADEFGGRWRAQTELALVTMPAEARPRRLGHCVVRPSRHSVIHDGVAISWHDDESAASEHDRWMSGHPSPESPLDEAASMCVRVEARTVNGPDRLDAIWSDRDASALVLIGFIEPAHGLSRDEFRDYWWDRHRPLASRLVPPELGTEAYVHNYVMSGEPGQWAGIGELYESSLAGARDRAAWFASDAALELIADEERFLVRDTRQVLVMDLDVLVGAFV